MTSSPETTPGNTQYAHKYERVDPKPGLQGRQPCKCQAQTHTLASRPLSPWNSGPPSPPEKKKSFIPLSLLICFAPSDVCLPFVCLGDFFFSLTVVVCLWAVGSFFIQPFFLSFFLWAIGSFFIHPTFLSFFLSHSDECNSLNMVIIGILICLCTFLYAPHNKSIKNRNTFQFICSFLCAFLKCDLHLRIKLCKYG